jgi:hypothetical protein
MHGARDRLDTLRPAQGSGPRRPGNRPALGHPLGDLSSGKAKSARVHRPRSTVHRPPEDRRPSTVDRLLADIRTTLAAELQPLRSRLEALETAITIRPDREAPSTGHGGPCDLGAQATQALDPLDDLRPPGHEGGAPASRRRAPAKPEHARTRGPRAVAGGGDASSRGTVGPSLGVRGHG